MSVSFETTRFHHFEYKDGHVTVAYQVDQNKGAQIRKVRYACSFTSPKDTFNRAKGRQIAEGRLAFLNTGVARARLMAEELEIVVPNDKPLCKILEGVRQGASDLVRKRCSWARF